MVPCSWTFLSSLPGNKFFRNPLRPLRRAFDGERMGTGGVAGPMDAEGGVRWPNARQSKTC
ncbi:MAG: hypothetical protein H6Q87_602 [candidate division NC10 bacterium]|nr:hypothetical protein [candidate division NC10 bacterium]